MRFDKLLLNYFYLADGALELLLSLEQVALLGRLLRYLTGLLLEKVSHAFRHH